MYVLYNLHTYTDTCMMYVPCMYVCVLLYNGSWRYFIQKFQVNFYEWIFIHTAIFILYVNGELACDRGSHDYKNGRSTIYYFIIVIIMMNGDSRLKTENKTCWHNWFTCSQSIFFFWLHTHTHTVALLSRSRRSIILGVKNKEWKMTEKREVLFAR